MNFDSRQLVKYKSSRAAVVPYTIIYKNDTVKLWFLFGIHTESGDISDFGGGVKKDENDLIAGFREFNEETKEIFKDVIGLDDMANCASAYKQGYGNNRGMSVTFIPIHPRWLDTAVCLFKSTTIKHEEISDILWISEIDFTNLLNGFKLLNRTMWSRLRTFYQHIYNYDLHRKLCLSFYSTKPTYHFT